MLKTNTKGTGMTTALCLIFSFSVPAFFTYKCSHNNNTTHSLVGSECVLMGQTVTVTTDQWGDQYIVLTDGMRYLTNIPRVSLKDCTKTHLNQGADRG